MQSSSSTTVDVDVEHQMVVHPKIKSEGGIELKEGEIHDAVWGVVSADGPSYRNLGWFGTSVLLMKTQIGLGVLAIPSVFQALGLLPGMVILVAVACMTTWSDWVVGQSKRNHPEIWGPSEVGQVIGGRIGREIFGVMFFIYCAALAGSGLLSLSISLNAVSLHALCTAGWVAIVTVIGFGLSSIQTLDKVSWLGWVGMVSILSALGTVTIAVGVQDRPADAPMFGDWKLDVVAVGDPTFAEAMNAIATVCFAFSGTPAFYPVIAEMRDPRDYNKAMGLCQVVVTLVYTIVGVVVYACCGQYVANPALGSAGPLLKRIAYGLAIPALFVTVCIFSHMSSKYIFVRLFHGKKSLTDNSVTHWIGWLSCCAGCMLFSYVIASAVPVFGGLVGLLGAIFATPLCMQLLCMVWWKDNRHRWATDKTWGYRFHVFWALLIFCCGSFFTVGGAYGAILDLIKAEGSSPWTCADNSNSV